MCDLGQPQAGRPFSSPQAAVCASNLRRWRKGEPGLPQGPLAWGGGGGPGSEDGQSGKEQCRFLGLALRVLP